MSVKSSVGSVNQSNLSSPASSHALFELSMAHNNPTRSVGQSRIVASTEMSVDEVKCTENEMPTARPKTR